jgi:DNA-directed RNA polymerase specialized sigma subunit
MANPTSDKTQYEEQENQLLRQSESFLQILTKRGLVGDQEITDERVRKAEMDKKRRMYHNTMLMLQNYREIVWALECFPSQIAEELERPLQSLDTLLTAVDAQIAMDNKKLERRLESVQKSRLLIDRVNEALTVLKKKPRDGEMMYNIIYQTFITAETLTHTEILYRLNISSRHYYRLRTQAVNILSLRLWAVPAAELDSWLEVLTLLESM